MKEGFVTWTSSQKSLSTMVNNRKINMKKLQIAILATALAGAMSASAAYVVEQGGLPYTQPSTDVSWASQNSPPLPGWWDAGGSFSIGGSGTYTVTGITVWDVVNTSAGTPTGLSLLNASGATISSVYTATLATYGNGANYVDANPDGYPPATLYKLDFTLNETLSAGSYQFFLDGGFPTLYPDGNYYTPFLLCANDAGPDLVPWLENVGATDGTGTTVGTWPDTFGDAYVQVVPEPTTMIAGALLLLPFGASTLRLLRKTRTA
ncbi:MAG: hypothetical protein ABSB84_15250 [Verrucomicrobiota bacterium]|jgi:hypothetical protein